MALTTMTCFAQYEQDSSIKIWDNSTAPHSNELTGEEYNQKPFRLVNTTSAELFVYNADKAKATGQAVVICPGGGYGQLSMDQEGFLMAQWLAKNGIAGFVLKYRLPNGHKEVPLEDAIEALRIVRKNADKYGIDPHKVGIMGFSAGGHLAAYTSNYAEEKDKPYSIPSSRPTTIRLISVRSTTFLGVTVPNARATLIRWKSALRRRLRRRYCCSATMTVRSLPLVLPCTMPH